MNKLSRDRYCSNSYMLQEFSSSKKKKKGLTETCLKIEHFTGDFSCASSQRSAAETGPVHFPNPCFWQAASSRDGPPQWHEWPRESRKHQYRWRRGWFARVSIRKICCRAVPIAGEWQNHLGKPAAWLWQWFTHALRHPDPGEKLH